MAVQQGVSLKARANHADRDGDGIDCAVGGVLDYSDIEAGLVRRPAGAPRNAMLYH
jgi:hypothetical protein